MRKKQYLKALLGWGGLCLSMALAAPVVAGAEADVTAGTENMMRLPGGELAMGSKDGNTDEKPVHTVKLDPFYMDTYEVSQLEYEQMMDANPSRFKGDDLPVDSVTWHEAKEYCGKVSKRLPTEAEWEFAAGGGSKSKFFWGDEIDGHFLWYEGNSGVPVTKIGEKHAKVFPLHVSRAGGGTHPVGQKSSNLFGLHDMSGNVWEWVWDWYHPKYYKLSKRINNPGGPKNGKMKVNRGGSWYSGESQVRTAKRGAEEPNKRSNSLGFRCALSISSKP